MSSSLPILIYIFFPKKTGNNGADSDPRRFPIGTSGTEFSYWKPRLSLETPTVVKETSKGVEEYLLPEEDLYDYLGNVLFSPEKTFICVESGASGYWGYLLGKISGNKVEKLLRGPQYSYCLNWLTDERILLKEQPYGEEKTYFYSYNVLTAEKNLLFTENIGFQGF